MNHTIERLAQPRLPTHGRVKRGNSDHSVIRFCKNWLIVVHDTPRYVLTTGNSNAGYIAHLDFLSRRSPALIALRVNRIRRKNGTVTAQMGNVKAKMYPNR